MTQLSVLVCSSEFTACRLFSLKPWKLRHPWRQSGISGSLLLHIWSLQSTAHLKPFLRNFFVYEKHVRYTPGWSNSSFQDLVMDFQRLFYTNHEFENRTFDWVRLIFFSFWWVRFRSIAELNRTQSMNWVWLSSIGLDWLCRGFYNSKVHRENVFFPFRKHCEVICSFRLSKRKFSLLAPSITDKY